MKLSRPFVLRLALLVVLVAVALFLVLRTLPRIERYRTTEEVCAATDRGDWAAALAASEGLIANDTAGRRAAQCRCRALLATGEREACVALLEDLLAAESEDDWLPDPTLTALVVAARDEAGEPSAAADLANRGAIEYPEDVLLAHQEMTLRSRVEDEADVLAEMARRLEGRESVSSYAVRLDLARRHSARGEWQEALDLLGDDPDAFPATLGDSWFEARAAVIAGLGRADQLAELFAEWERRGGKPTDLLARHAILRSSNQIEDREGTTLGMLREVAERGDELSDTELLGVVDLRLIRTLVLAGEHDEALALYDQVVAERGELEFLKRDDILRAATQEALGEEGMAAAWGTIRFRVPDARPGDRLLVSPPVDATVDSAYVEAPVAPSRSVEVTRSLDTWPVRWVLRSARGRTAGSGAAWVRPGEIERVTVERRPAGSDPSDRPDAALGPARPADGERRVFQIILDCADWRIVRYGLARGELPFFEHAIEHGHRAVLDSYPPFTALAITRLVNPRKRGLRSFPELVHQLGREIEGLNFVGRNPFGALEGVLPEETDLFSTLAGEGFGTVNLLHSHGALQVGRNAQVIGPGDAVRPIEGYRSSRPLAPAEEELLQVDSQILRGHLQEMAADFDVVAELTAEPGIELVSVRVAALDLMTHGSFQDFLPSGQDDGNGVLYRTYRYVDERLGEIYRRLDADDTLIVMSDHGIRTPMEHDRRAMFVALGAGVEPGRTDDVPPLQHVSGWIADLLGVAVDWPGNGTEEWIRPTGPPPRTGSSGRAGAAPE